MNGHFVFFLLVFEGIICIRYFNYRDLIIVLLLLWKDSQIKVQAKKKMS